MNLAVALLDLAYPRRCGGCGAVVRDQPGHFCWNCLAGLHVIQEPFCDRCGDPVEGMIEHGYTCSLCRRHEPGFVRARSAVRYRGPICQMLQSFKYRQCAHLAFDLAPMLLATVRTQYAGTAFDAVGAVPLYRVRERARSYNQSRLLADRLRRLMEVESLPAGAIRRVRNTPTQTGLTADARRENVDGAFEAGSKEWLQGRTVLLVDDVMTTGATVSACAAALRAGGCAGVYVVTVARG